MSGVAICPFQVGDRVQSKDIGLGLGKPSTVTAVHERGFDWRLDEPQILAVRDGSWYQTGTCFPSGFEHYELCPLNAEISGAPNHPRT